MSESPTSTFPPEGSSTSHASTPQVTVSSCQQMAQSQLNILQTICLHQSEEEGNICLNDTFCVRTAAVNRRHSTDGAVGLGSRSAAGRGPAELDRFHPYRRQVSDGAVTAVPCLQDGSSSFGCLKEMRGEMPTYWDQHSGGMQGSPRTYAELPAVSALDAPCFLSSRYPSYSSSPLHQFSSKLYPTPVQPSNTKFSLQSLSAPSHQESPSQSLFPKPVYSYSILIFMALKNSRTGSLPVSEIYGFMTEHFPYFKTAPDGWKNSVRHNLSLNKCFEKVENKNGNTSRKGCLWALNPAKVEKMQEELHKWRRKDPVTVRRSMARPEDLDRLLGVRPDQLSSLPPYTNSPRSSRVAPVYPPSSSSCSPAQLRRPIQRSQYSHIPPPAQHSCYFPPTAHQPSDSFSIYSPCGQQLSALGHLNSPVAAKMPPIYPSALQAEYSFSHRSAQDFLLDVDASYDVDTLNPSLTDLQLQGNLWEELRADSLVSDPHVVSTTTVLLPPHSQTGSLQGVASGNHTSGVIAIGRRKGEYEEGNVGSGRGLESHGCVNGLHPVVHSGAEYLAG
ncbi:forkhead box protein N1 [Genypterus blacodes]|uniref:forkhead box protein N1 n=1 Tax=Genypterus blacodes TaxID=154954 RepID=UPI003F76A5C3